MMRSLFVVVLMLGAASVSAHAAEPAPSDAQRLQESQAKWHKVREACGGNYVLKFRWSSAFGFGNLTTITVKDNKVVARQFEVFGGGQVAQPGGPPAGPQVKWTETEKDLGSHKEGAPPRTADELYAVAAKIVEAKLAEFQVRSLHFDKQGLLQYCATRDSRIADDAPQEGVPYFTLETTAPAP